MNAELKQNKQAIRDFLRTEVWTDELLCALLAHAEDKLCMGSCCCLRGFPTADHAFKGRNAEYRSEEHYQRSGRLPKAFAAEIAFFNLGNNYGAPYLLDQNPRRRNRIRPIIRAELRRRDRLRATSLRQHDTEIAILLAAGGTRTMLAEPKHCALLAGVAAEDLAEIMLHGAVVTVREGGDA